MHAATSKPPFEPPCIVNMFAWVYFSSTKYSAAAWKSSKTFCLFLKRPALCQLSPYSLKLNFRD